MTTPAGWHPDPHDPNQKRYWDGTAWTEYTAAMPPPAAPPKQKLGCFVWGLIILVGLFVVGSLMNAGGIGGSDSGQSQTSNVTPSSPACTAAPRSVLDAIGEGGNSGITIGAGFIAPVPVAERNSSVGPLTALNAQAFEWTEWGTAAQAGSQADDVRQYLRHLDVTDAVLKCARDN